MFDVHLSRQPVVLNLLPSATNLNTWAFMVSAGLLVALGILIISIIASYSTQYLHNVVNFLASVYPGYQLTYGGVALGAIWGFIDAAIGGFIFAWSYNKLAQ